MFLQANLQKTYKSLLIFFAFFLFFIIFFGFAFIIIIIFLTRFKKKIQFFLFFYFFLFFFILVLFPLIKIGTVNQKQEQTRKKQTECQPKICRALFGSGAYLRAWCWPSGFCACPRVGSLLRASCLCSEPRV